MAGSWQPLTSQPSFSWTASGGGTINASGLFTAGTTGGGPFTVTATSGSVSGTASVTVSATLTPVYRINCGGSAVSPQPLPPGPMVCFQANCAPIRNARPTASQRTQPRLR